MILVFGLTAGLVVIFLGVIFLLMTQYDRSVIFGGTETFEHDGMERTYRLHVPSEITPNTKLIVGMHGFGGNSRRFAYYTALHNADPDSLIVYPDAVKPAEKGLKTGWNAKFCCGSGWVGKIDDVGFITSLVGSLAKEYSVSPSNVFAAGFSNGAFMTHRLAAERPDVFKAVATASGTVGTNKAQVEPKEPVPILIMHGENDKIVPFDGGVGSSDPDFQWLDFSATKQTWQQVNGESAHVEVQTFQGDGHRWHDWRLFRVWHKVPQASERAIHFFDSQ